MKKLAGGIGGPVGDSVLASQFPLDAAESVVEVSILSRPKICPPGSVGELFQD